MDEMTWMSEVLLDMAAFAEENSLPKSYDAFLKAMAVTNIEIQQNGRLKQRETGNIVPLFKQRNRGGRGISDQGLRWID